MGSKHAGIHLRCEDSTAVLACLKKEFSKKKGPSTKDLAAIAIIEAFARKNINSIADDRERAEKEADMARIMEQARIDMSGGDPAVIVLREHFVSVYWYDHIRPENLGEELAHYAVLCGVPALGAAVYDDSNFQICAVRDVDVESYQARRCVGQYWFDYDDVQPADPAELCAILDADFLLPALTEALSQTDGEAMADCFEARTGLPILMDEGLCRTEQMRELHRWDGAVVFQACPSRNALDIPTEK